MLHLNSSHSRPKKKNERKNAKKNKIKYNDNAQITIVKNYVCNLFENINTPN